MALDNQTIVWTFYPNLQNRGIAQCGNVEFIGSSTVQFNFLTMSRQFTSLPAHTGVVLYFTLYQIDGNYLNSSSLFFTFNNQRYDINNIPNITQLNNLRNNLCGNSILDSQFVVQLQDNSHTADTLDFVVNLETAGKIGIA